MWRRPLRISATMRMRKESSKPIYWRKMEKRRNKNKKRRKRRKNWTKLISWWLLRITISSPLSPSSSYSCTILTKNQFKLSLIFFRTMLLRWLTLLSSDKIISQMPLCRSLLLRPSWIALACRVKYTEMDWWSTKMGATGRCLNYLEFSSLIICLFSLKFSGTAQTNKSKELLLKIKIKETETQGAQVPMRQRK